MSRLDSRQIAEWYAFSLLEPFGPEYDWQRYANLACIIGNAFKAKKSKTFDVDDFRPKIVTDEERVIEGQRKVLHNLYAWAVTEGKTRD